MTLFYPLLWFLFIWSVFSLFSDAICEIRSTKNDLLARQKRFLLFIPGVNWVELIGGIGTPLQLKDQSVTIGATVKAFYLLPTNSTIFTNPTFQFMRKRRSISRWDFYATVVDFIEKSGYGDGKACLLRAICEISVTPIDQKSGLLAEILSLFLTPSSTNEIVDHHNDVEYHAAERVGKKLDRCHDLFPECDISIVEQFTKLTRRSRGL